MMLWEMDVPNGDVHVNLQPGGTAQRPRRISLHMYFQRLLIAALATAIPLFATFLSAPAVAQEIDADREYNLKSVFLYSFGRYMTWNAAPNAGDFEIGVLGASPIVEKLEQIATKRNLKGRALKIRTGMTADELEGLPHSFCFKRRA